MKTLIQDYHYQVETAKEKLSQTCYESLINRNIEDIESLEIAHSEYIHSLQHADYYKIIDRIDNAEKFIAAETDMKKKNRYIKVMKELCIQLESMTNKRA